MYTRRDFGRMAAGALVAGVAGNRLHARETLIGGVRIGAISYCFRSIPRPAAGDYMDTLIDAFRQTGLATCELESVRVEPEPAIAGGGRVPATITPEYTKRREELRQWRLTTPLGRFTRFAASSRRPASTSSDTSSRSQTISPTQRSIVHSSSHARSVLASSARIRPACRWDRGSLRLPRNTGSRSAGTTTPMSPIQPK